MTKDSPPALSEMPCCKIVKEPPEAAHYSLSCVLEEGHEGPCHAHLFHQGAGQDTARCSCGLEAGKPERVEEIGQVVQVAPAPKRIDVVTGIIVRHGRILLVQRLPYKEFGYMWECPGGKVEARETLQEALLRELREEIGLRFESRIAGYRALTDAAMRNRVLPMDFDPPTVGRACRLHYFHVPVPPAWEPECNEGIGFGWFTRDEAVKLTLAPGNRELHRLWKATYHNVR